MFDDAVRAFAVVRSTGLTLLLLGGSATCFAEGPPVPDRLLLSGHGDAVYDVAFSPDGKHLATGSYDKTIRLWRVSDGGLIGTLEGHSDQVFRIDYSPDGSRLASCSGDGSAILWDVSALRRVSKIMGHGDPMLDVGFSASGQSLATVGSHVQIWHDEKELWATPHSELYFSLDFSPDQGQLACGTRNEIHLFDVGKPEVVQKLNAGRGMVYQVIFSPGGKWLASACSDGVVTLWDCQTWEQIGTVNADAYALFAACFGSDGTQLVTAGRERVIRTWSLPDFELRSERYGPEETILSLALSPDGKRLACGSYDGLVHLWALPEKTVAH